MSVWFVGNYRSFYCWMCGWFSAHFDDVGDAKLICIS